MEARNHEHVKRAGALKAHAQRMRQVSAVAGHHRGQHDGVVLAEAQRRRASGAWPRAERAVARCAACCNAVMRQASKCVRARWPMRSTRSMPTRGRGGDALVEQIIRAAPGAGIVIDFRRQQADHGANSISAVEGLRAEPAHRFRGQRTVSRTPPTAAVCASMASSTSRYSKRGDRCAAKGLR